MNEDSIKRAREGFRTIAIRGAVCFDTCQYLREANFLYQSSYRQFLEIFDNAISHSERFSIFCKINILNESYYFDYTDISCMSQLKRLHFMTTEIVYVGLEGNKSDFNFNSISLE